MCEGDARQVVISVLVGEHTLDTHSLDDVSIKGSRRCLFCCLLCCVVSVVLLLQLRRSAERKM